MIKLVFPVTFASFPPPYIFVVVPPYIFKLELVVVPPWLLPPYIASIVGVFITFILLEFTTPL